MNLEPETNTTESESPQEFDIEAFLKLAVSQGVSDIHLRVGTVPMVRRNGLMMRSKLTPLTTEDMNRIINRIVPERILPRVASSHDLDFSLEIPNVSRFRVNLLHDLGELGFVLRVIPYNIPALDGLYLPPILKSFTGLENGLVLVTGPTGSGKSTTLASMLDFLNQSYQKHVVTLEDPVEFIHPDKKCVFTQRQLGIDTDSFPNGLKYALRQDPDVILIGEMRDRETISSALKAAETGHLVFSTLHTTGAIQTINRIINAFEPYERDAVRLQIAATLRGTVAQKLVKRADTRGRVPATEILVVTPAIKDYIIKDEIESIYRLLKEGDFNGMMSMDLSLFRLVKSGLITAESAIQASDTPNELQQFLNGAFHSTGNFNE